MKKENTPQKTDQDIITPSLTIDWDLYLSHLEDSDMSDDQKRDFIQTLWNIVVSFVDLGFDIHPLQQAREKCSGQDDDLAIAIQQSVVSSRGKSKANKDKYAVNEDRSHSAGSEDS